MGASGRDLETAADAVGVPATGLMRQERWATAAWLERERPSISRWTAATAEQRDDPTLAPLGVLLWAQDTSRGRSGGLFHAHSTVVAFDRETVRECRWTFLLFRQAALPAGA